MVVPDSSMLTLHLKPAEIQKFQQKEIFLLNSPPPTPIILTIFLRVIYSGLVWVMKLPDQTKEVFFSGVRCVCVYVCVYGTGCCQLLLLKPIDKEWEKGDFPENQDTIARRMGDRRQVYKTSVCRYLP